MLTSLHDRLCRGELCALLLLPGQAEKPEKPQYWQCSGDNQFQMHFHQFLGFGEIVLDLVVPRRMT